MKDRKSFFSDKFIKGLYLCLMPYAVCLCIGAADAADVVQRNTSAKAPAAAAGRARPSAASAPRAAAVAIGTEASAEEEIIWEEEPAAAAVMEEELAPPVETKAAQFDEVLQESGGAGLSGESALRDMIAAQRSAEAASAVVSMAGSAPAANAAEACDNGLRDCMKKKCGTDFEKCAGDGDTIWGDKMSSCRNTTKCTGAEFSALAPEIKAWRDMFQNVGLFSEVQTCGGDYNDCIIKECGDTFDKCLGKSAGDKAIANCKKIADKCKIADSGLSARVMDVFGRLRTDAEIRVQESYKRLLEMPAKMEAECKKIGAMFDARSFECLFTVEISNSSLSEHPLASKKLRPGSSYICSPDWFGIDATTFMEEAQRMTRAQRGASSAFMGGMIGAGAGTFMNAAQTGALKDGKTFAQEDKETADQAMSQECEAQGGAMVGRKCSFDEKDIKAAEAKEKGAEAGKKGEEATTTEQKKNDLAALVGKTREGAKSGDKKAQGSEKKKAEPNSSSKNNESTSQKNAEQKRAMQNEGKTSNPKKETESEKAWNEMEQQMKDIGVKGNPY